MCAIGGVPVEYDPSSRWPSRTHTAGNVDDIRSRLREDRHVTVSMLSEELNLVPIGSPIDNTVTAGFRKKETKTKNDFSHKSRSISENQLILIFFREI